MTISPITNANGNSLQGNPHFFLKVHLCNIPGSKYLTAYVTYQEAL